MSQEKVKSRTEAFKDVVSSVRQLDLSVLGDSIKSLPVSQWRRNMIFYNVPDTDLRELTADVFPATLRVDKTTHPVFVLKDNPVGHYVCPCSTKGHSARQRYVRRGCQLEMHDETMQHDCFLVEACGFTLPIDQRFTDKPLFMGLVPQSCLIDRREK